MKPTPAPTRRKPCLGADQAQTLAKFMREVVTSGTGRRAAAAVVPMAGKTGTAELQDADSHAWFIGFAPYGSAAPHRIAFSVLVENGIYGGTAAAPAAAEIVNAAVKLGLILSRPNEPPTMSLFSGIEKSIERGFQRWTERLFGAAESNELLLVHRAILEEIETKIETLARGRRIFPFRARHGDHRLARRQSPRHARDRVRRAPRSRYPRSLRERPAARSRATSPSKCKPSREAPSRSHRVVDKARPAAARKRPPNPRAWS